MPDLAQVLLGSLILLMFAASIGIWARIAARLRAGQAILPAEPRVLVPWTVFDLYIVLLLYIAAQWASAKAVVSIVGHAPDGAALSPEFLAPLLASNALANLLVVLASIIYLRLRCGPAIGDLGFLPWRPGYDLPLGVLTFIAALAPVFSIQYLLTRWFKSEHPVQLLLSENSSPRVLLLCVLSAVVVAPLAEEFLFRVLLQGWMEAVAMRWRREREPDISPLGDAIEFTPQAFAPPAADSSVGLMPWPIILSSLAFALVHWGHGPDPIPLFVLALLLGYLYQKTHRIWPSLVVHACLNTWSLTMLWLNLKLGLGE